MIIFIIKSARILIIYNNWIISIGEMSILKQNQMVFMMNQFRKILRGFDKAQQTIICFSVYQDQHLQKLHIKQNMAFKILDPELNIELHQTKVKKKTIISYELKPESLLKSKITTDIFKVQQKYQGQKDENKNIIIHRVERNGKMVRLVMIPIEEKLMSIGELKELTKELKTEQDKFHTAQKQLAGQALKTFKNEFVKTQKLMKKKIVEKMRIKHLKMYNIEAILSILMQKTETISFLGVLDIEGLSNVQSQMKKTTQVFNQLVQNGNTQFLKYNVDSQDGKENEDDETSTILVINEANDVLSLGIHKNDAFNEKYFVPTNTITVNIYKQMHQEGNEYLSEAIEEFKKTWDDIVYLSSTPIAAIVKNLYGSLKLPGSFSKNLLSSETKLEESSMKQSLEILTYREVFQRFNVNSDIELTENVAIKKYLTVQTLSRGEKVFEVGKGQRLIPQSIENLVFLHYFYRMNKDFLKKYAQVEKQGYQALLEYVRLYVFKIYQLANDINDSYLMQNQNESVRCADIQKYFNFLSFLFKSLKHMKQITKREFSICGVLKALFQNLQPKQNVLLEYIVKNEDTIKRNEVIHYYDLYLQLIKENGQNIENELQYIYLVIHMLKANRIAGQFSGVKGRVVEAIRSYCEIIYKYDLIPENKKENIDKFDIQKRIARLLIILGRLGQSLLIFKKNHILTSVEKTFKLIIKQFTGNRRAEECMSVAKYFQRQSAFDKALEYFRLAHDTAKDAKIRKSAKESQFICLDLYMEKRVEERKAVTRYTKNDGSEQEYNSWQNMSPEDQKHRLLYQNLRNNLTWDQERQESEILVGDNLNESELLS